MADLIIEFCECLNPVAESAVTTSLGVCRYCGLQIPTVEYGGRMLDNGNDNRRDGRSQRQHLIEYWRKLSIEELRVVRDDVDAEINTRHTSTGGRQMGTKYLIFSGLRYYPAGGFEDMLKTDANPQSLEDCKLIILDAIADESNYYGWDWIQVVDLDLCTIVKKFDLFDVLDVEKAKILSEPW